MPDAAGGIPDHFMCPISLDIMWDPVTVSTGHTFDRPSIEAWLSTGNSTCPVTRAPLAADIIPNLTLRRLIRHWCFSHHPSFAAAIPTPNAPADPSFLRYLLSRSSPTSGLKTPARVAALARLSRLVRGSEENLSLFSSIAETRHVLMTILFAPESDSDELRNESLAVLANFQLTETDCNSVASDSNRIGFLIGLMFEPNTIDVRANAAAVIGLLLAGTASPELRLRIVGVERVFEAVVAVIRDGIFFRRAVKVGVKALFELCLSKQSRSLAVVAGAVAALVDLLAASADVERGDAEGALATAELLCSVPSGREAFAAHPMTARALVRTILKVSERATEQAVGLLLVVCTASEKARREAVAEGVLARLLLVVQSGCALRGKRKAVRLLKLLRCSWPRDSFDNSDNYCCWSGVVPY